jgi:hypothetical protein
MSFLARIFRATERIAPDRHIITSWESLNDTQKDALLEMFSTKLREVIQHNEKTICLLDDTFCNHDNGMCIEEIPYNILINVVKSITDMPFIITPVDVYFVLTFVQNLERVTAIMAPSHYIAKAAVSRARDMGELCTITHESLKEINDFCVGGCGHVFSTAASTLSSCPNCREAVVWTIVKSTDL